MKKVGLILFVLGLGFLSITGNQCKKKIVSDDSVDTTTTIKVPPKDTSGEDLHVTVYQYTTTSGSAIAAGATVYLLNNFHDWTNYTFKNYDSIPKSKFVDSATAQGDGTCTFTKVKPSSNPSHTFTPNPKYGDYTYYVVASWTDKASNMTLWGAYALSASSPGDAISVAINNGLGNAGIQVPVAVKP